MKKRKLSWALRLENLIRKPKEMLEDWFIYWVKYSIDEELNKNIFMYDESNEILDYFSTTSAGYQVGMIILMENKKFLIERIEVDKKCIHWDLYGKVIN
ncbi:hypothetical protein [Flavobacterium hungaricum]|uniref:Uncharacterized protein n=1 Tax=Flavobacterium hungaricum TaxID=2082725 RepID=A0ABR9TRF8_9FLAO|nr:hypothetical protein [Flavobacterium hungaricum]MBE8727968.1 hypothetical protein [Flavobacterium hungaricum]